MKGIETLRLTAGESVLVIGQGPIGIILAQVLTPGHSFSWTVVPAISTNGKATVASPKTGFTVAPLGTPAAVSPTGRIASHQPTFTWTTGADASHTAAKRFTLTIKDTSNGRTLTIANLTGSSYTLTAKQALTPGHNFSWSVTTFSTNGKATAQSAAAKFTIAPIASPTALVFTSSNNTFSWQSVTDAGQYSLKVVDSTNPKIVSARCWLCRRLWARRTI